MSARIYLSDGRARDTSMNLNETRWALIDEGRRQTIMLFPKDDGDGSWHINPDHVVEVIRLHA